MRLVILLVFLGAWVHASEDTLQLKTIHLLNTAGGIKNDTSCSVYAYQVDELGGVQYAITCNDGSIMEHPVVLEGSTTGTPAWLTYENFVGSYEVSKGIVPGQGRVKLFFDGPARLKR